MRCTEGWRVEGILSQGSGKGYFSMEGGGSERQNQLVGLDESFTKRE